MRPRTILMNTLFPCVGFLASVIAGVWVSDAQGACALGTCITVTPPSTSSGRPGGGGPVYSGPSQEDLRRQREQKDSREAADDANDRGADFYDKGDWEKAASYFKEALEYDPDNADIRSNLSRAQHKLQEARATEAGRQLKSVEQHSQQALQKLTDEAASEEARKGFDTGGKPAGNLGSSAVYGGDGGYKEPVVPASRRTPAIAALERQRNDSRKQIQALEEKLKQLDPGKNPVEVAKMKQAKSNAERKTQYLNFKIGEELEKPAQVTPSNAAK